MRCAKAGLLRVYEKCRGGLSCLRMQPERQPQQRLQEARRRFRAVSLEQANRAEVEQAFEVLVAALRDGILVLGVRQPISGLGEGPTVLTSDVQINALTITSLDGRRGLPLFTDSDQLHARNASATGLAAPAVQWLELALSGETTGGSSESAMATNRRGSAVRDRVVLPSGYAGLYLAMRRAVGGGMVASGLAMGLIVFTACRAGARWAEGGLFMIGAVLRGRVAVPRTPSVVSPRRPPWPAWFTAWAQC